jgi:hypothetical protein
MSLIVEDGTAKADAESFISVADSITYHDARGNLPWLSITTAQQEEALRRATDFMEEIYRERWAGYRRTSTQRLCWPRAWVPMLDAPSGFGRFYAYYASDSVPIQVQNACAELALRAAAGDLLADLKRGKLATNVGGIAVTYDRYDPQETRYKAIDSLLRPFLSVGSGAVRMVRV